MTDQRKILYVSTNEDNNDFVLGDSDSNVIGQGSLRGCIRYALGNNNEKFDIVFKQPPQDGAKGHDIDGMGYWVIKLKDVLPNIYAGDIRINHVSPRSVTLTNQDFSAKNGYKPQRFVEGQLSSSMLVVGDVRHTGSGGEPAIGAPRLEINGLNFIGHETKGGNAGANGGGGGGGAAGAAILHIAGDLKLKNVVFNHNRASAGTGAKQSPGGFGFKNTSNDDTSCKEDSKHHKKYPVSHGGKGGSGGQFATAIIRNSDKEGVAGYLSGRPDALRGGNGGANGFVFSSNDGSDGLAHGKDGSPGFSATLESQFGHGGGGGGGGGGRGRRNYHLTGCVVGANGKGGAGGRGGVLGGVGVKGGTTTADGVARGSLFNDENKQLKGNDGVALGDAIAVIGGLFGQTPQLELENVDFYEGATGGGADFLAYVGDQQPIIKQYNSKQYVGSNNQEKDGFEIRDAIKKESENIDSQSLVSGESSSENNIPFLEASSSPINRDVVKVRETVLSARDNISDVVFVDYEADDGNIGVYADLTNPDNELSKIWREIIPDETSNIRQELETLKNATYIENLLKGGEQESDEPKTNKQKVRDYGIQALEYGCKYDPTGICEYGAKFLKEAAEWHDNQARLQQEVQDRLDVATEKQKQLNEKLSHQNARIGEIKTLRSRTVVAVENFRLGSDILVLPYVEGRAITATAISDGARDRGVSLGFVDGTNESIPFLKLFFDQDSKANVENNFDFASLVTSLISVTNLDAEQTNSWASEGNKVSVLGTRHAKPHIQSDGINTNKGPASIDVIVNRSLSGARAGDNFQITTGMSGDQVIGSNGWETVWTGNGDDIIFPGLSDEGASYVDTIRGGYGEDLVSYVDVEDPLIFVAENQTGYDYIKVYDQANVEGDDKRLIAELSQVEFIHAYGASTVDLSGVKKEPGEVEDGHVDLPKHWIISGSGSEITGSAFNDEIEISFAEDYNWPDSRPGARSQATEAQKKDWYMQHSVIDGGEGEDVLKLNLSETPLIFEEVDSEGENSVELVYRETPGSDPKSFVTAINIETIEIVYPDRNRPRGLEKIEQDLILRADNMNGADLKGGRGDDSIELGKGSSFASGGKGNDELNGERGADRLFGNLGDDTLVGGPGRDVLAGGSGNDLLIGGPGVDKFVLGSGRNLIQDFRVGRDLLRFKGQLRLVDVANGSKLVASDGSSTTLMDVPSEELFPYLLDIGLDVI